MKTVRIDAPCISTRFNPALPELEFPTEVLLGRAVNGAGRQSNGPGGVGLLELGSGPSNAYK